MTATAQTAAVFRPSSWAILIPGLWALVSAILISHFRFYYEVDWARALKWGLGDGLLWSLLIAGLLSAFGRRPQLFGSRRGIVTALAVSIACGVILHPVLSTLFFWALDQSMSRPFHEDVLHLASKRFPQGILAGVAIAFAGYVISARNSSGPGQDVQPARVAVSERPTSLTLKDGQGLHRVLFDDIFYLEAAGNYVAVHGKSGERLNRTTLRALEEKLDGARFFRISRKHIVNLEAVRSVVRVTSKARVVALVNDVKLPLSQTYKEALQEALGGDAKEDRDS